MNWDQVRRIAWKDYRRLGPFRIALVAFWIISLGISTWAMRTHSIQGGTITFLVASTAVVYALGWGAITFAAEHEDKTFGFLRSLPVDAKHVFYGKLLFGVTSTFSLAAAIIALCFLHSLVLGRFGGG